MPSLIIILFGSALFGGERLAFRDISHFYTPLYGYIAERTAHELIPLWNPHCQTGMPLMGETTTAVLYPLRYLIGLMPLDAERQIAWYVVLHLVLASLNAESACGRAGGRRLARFIAGCSYPLSGSVFFLYTNPPFLVGAAWLPLVISMVLHPSSTPAKIRLACIGTGLAMMVLGGDPQTALHAVLVCAAITAYRFKRGRSAFKEIAVFLMGAGLSFALAAPQLAASIDWSVQSERTSQGVEDESWFQRPVAGSRKAEAMQYSVPPWHFAELLTRSAFGSLFPVNQRISALIPGDQITGDGKMWTPTLFMGMLPAIMIVDLLLRRRTPRSPAWLMVALAAALMSMGHFGLLWWIQRTTGLGQDTDGAALGPYWLMYHAFPSYDAFRYPAKWLPLMAIGLSIATGLWAEDTSPKIFRRAIGIIAAICMSCWLLTHLGQLGETSSITDEFWGPLYIHGGLREIRFSLLVSLISVSVLFLASKRFGSLQPRLVITAIVVVMTFELVWSATCQVASISVAKERQVLQSNLNDEHLSRGEKLHRRWMKVRTGSGWPPIWKNSSSTDRLLEVEASSRQNMFGRWHLDADQSVVNNFVSIRCKPDALFWQSLINAQKDELPVDWKAIQQWLGVDCILTQTSQVQTVELIPKNATGSLKSIAKARFKCLDKQVAAFSVQPVWRVDPSGRSDIEPMQKRFDEIIVGQTSDPIVSAETGVAAIRDPPILSSEMHCYPSTSSGEDSLSLTCGQSVLLVRDTYQDGHWIVERKNSQRAESVWERGTVHPVDYLKQGTVIPPGDWQIRFLYRPWWLWPSICLAIVGWTTNALMAAAHLKMTSWWSRLHLNQKTGST